MAVTEWTEWNAGTHPHQRGSGPAPAVVDTDGIEVLEGPAAEISHRIHVDRAQREALARAEVEQQQQLEGALRLLP